MWMGSVGGEEEDEEQLWRWPIPLQRRMRKPIKLATTASLFPSAHEQPLEFLCNNVATPPFARCHRCRSFFVVVVVVFVFVVEIECGLLYS